MGKWYSLTVGMILVFIFSCSRKSSVSVADSAKPLEVHGDSIRLTLQVKKGRNIDNDTLIHVYREGHGDAEIASVNIADFRSGKDTTINLAIPYAPGFEGTFQFDGGKLKNKASETSLTCCITTSRLLKTDFRMMFSGKMEVRSPLKLITQFNFPANSYSISDNSLSKKDLELITDFLSAKDTLSEITVITTASPEGTQAANDTITEMRAEAVKDWLDKSLRIAGYPDPESVISRVKVEKKEEDWEGFDVMLDSIKISENDKAAIKEVIKSKSPVAEKETRVSEILKGDLNKVEKALSPLRKATLVLQSGRPVRRDTELDSIAVSYLRNPDQINLEKVFSREEWLYTIGRMKGAEGRRTLMAAYYKTFPDDYTVFNDLGVISLAEDSACPKVHVCNGGKIDKPLSMNEDVDSSAYMENAVAQLPDSIHSEDIGEENGVIYENLLVADSSGKTLPGLDTALTFFEKADRIAPGNAEPSCNMACVYSLQGRYDAAVDYFRKSLAAMETDEATYNLGLVYAMAGNYSQALEEFKKIMGFEGIEYNLGITYLLLNNNAEAHRYLQNYLKKHPASMLTRYAIAVNFARQGKKKEADMTLSGLCENDSVLCKKAESDPEFRKLKSGGQ
jgi:tetratricopeptide (TPR) repeat protein